MAVMKWLPSEEPVDETPWQSLLVNESPTVETIQAGCLCLEDNLAIDIAGVTEYGEQKDTTIIPYVTEKSKL